MATVHQDRPDGQSTLTRTLSRLQPGVDRVLQERPYHPWHLLPLAAFLCESEWEYTDAARRVIVDALEQGASLDMLVKEGWLEPSDLPEAGRLLRSGRRWYRLYLASRAAAEESERSIERAERDRIERAYPIPADAVIVPPELEMLDELLDGPMDFPRPKSPADRRQDRADVAAFYRS
jgi:hypothetical protein